MFNITEEESNETVVEQDSEESVNDADDDTTIGVRNMSITNTVATEDSNPGLFDTGDFEKDSFEIPNPVVSDNITIEASASIGMGVTLSELGKSRSVNKNPKRLRDGFQKLNAL